MSLSPGSVFAAWLDRWCCVVSCACALVGCSLVGCSRELSHVTQCTCDDYDDCVTEPVLVRYEQAYLLDACLRCYAAVAMFYILFCKQRSTFDLLTCPPSRAWAWSSFVSNPCSTLGADSVVVGFGFVVLFGVREAALNPGTDGRTLTVSVRRFAPRFWARFRPLF